MKAWQQTVANAANTPYLACLRNSTTDCAGQGGAFLLYNSVGNLVYDATAGTNGFMSNGQACTGFDSVNGNNNCPFHLQLTWTPECPASGTCYSPVATVKGHFVFKPASVSRTIAINSQNYDFQVTAGTGGGSAGAGGGTGGGSSFHTVQTHDPSGVTYACNTTYQAATDGFINASGRPFTGQPFEIYGGPDSAAVTAQTATPRLAAATGPINTQYIGGYPQDCSGCETIQISTPMKKNDYWRVACGPGCLYQILFFPYY